MNRYGYRLKFTIPPNSLWTSQPQELLGGYEEDCHYTFPEATYYLLKAIAQLEKSNGEGKVNYIEASVQPLLG
jgi:hypothetical protein